MNQQLIDESTKYGLAIMVLVFVLISCGFIITAMWNNQKKTQDKFIDIIQENTTAFQQLQSSISMLISILGKK